MKSAELRARARALGVQSSYTGNDGRRHRAGDDSLDAVLSALGATAPGEVTEGLGLPPVAVAWEGRFALELEPSATGRRAVALVLEDGGEHPVTVGSGSGSSTLVAAEGRLPFGRHRLVVGRGRGQQVVHVISAPRRTAGLGRARGVMAPVPALHGPDRAIDGTVSDLADLAGWVARQGGDLVGTLPLLAPAPSEVPDPSPYSPGSKRLWNPAAVDLQSVPEVGRVADASALLGDLEADRTADLIPVATRHGRHRELLALMADAAGHDPVRQQALAAFVADHPLVSQQAAFEEAAARHGPSWSTWPAEALAAARRPDPGATIGPSAYGQWLAAEQVQSLARRCRDTGVRLLLDLPVGIHPDGFDRFAEPELFVAGVSVGAPPDAFFSRGQVWGFPPVHPLRSRADGHRYWQECLAHHMAAADVLRIDHVMGLHRQFWVPHGADATAGVYVRQPAEELWAIVCLESHRHGCAVVGEDLGTVPAEVRRTMARHRATGMWVLPFAVDADTGAHPPPAEALATTGTHDTATFAGHWTGTDIDDRLDMGLLDDDEATAQRVARSQQRAALARHLRTDGHLLPDAEAKDVEAMDAESTGELLEATLRWLADQPGPVAVPLEDLWLETQPQNVPGTTDERPNWRRRFRHSLEELDGEPARRLRLLTGSDATVPTSPEPPPDAGASRQPAAAAPAASPPLDVAGLTDVDLHLFNEGTHVRLHEKLGAHPAVVDGQAGTTFAVWAPNAEGVSVIGPFCRWDPEAHPLAPVGSAGIWSGFVAGVGPGEVYKLHIRSRHGGYRVDKADPFAFATEMPPATASVVADLSYQWGDDDWMATRAQRNALDAPMSVYEVHLGSWRRVPEDGNRSLHYTEAAERLADHVTHLGFTHVELLPITEHPFFGSWGYQTTSYFAPTARHGSPTELMHLIDTLHQRGIGVILDWVPSHFPSDEHGLVYFDGTHLFEHADPRKGFHPDWNSYIFNYGRHEVRSFLLSSAMFWLDRYHLDGLRVDAVASMLYLDYSRAEGEWIPNELGGRENLEAIGFLRALNEAVYAEHPDVQTIAEESTAWPMVSRPTYVGGLGFGLKWDMGWMHDTLEYFAREPVHRRWHHGELTFRMVYAHNENFMLPLSHDEVVHGKGSLLSRMPGDEWQRFANLRALYGYQFAQPGKKLLFMGAELGQPGEWDHDGSLDWHLLDAPLHRGLQAWLRHMNRLHQEEPALHQRDFHPDGFQWVEAHDADQSVIAFLRWSADGDPVLVALNLTPVAREGYRLGVPRRGTWLELANSDAEEYGGSGTGNLGKVETTPFPSHGHDQSLVLTLPPLGVLFLAPG